MSQGKQLSEDQLRQAAELLALGQTVTSVAKVIDCDRCTLSRYVNHSDEYKAIAAELIATFKAQGLPVAWRQLIDLAGGEPECLHPEGTPRARGRSEYLADTVISLSGHSSRAWAERNSEARNPNATG